MFEKINQLYNKIKSSLKLTIIAIAVAVAGFLVVVNWILPNEQAATIEITQKNDVISSNYDKTTNSYQNPELVKKLQTEVIKRDSDLSVVKLFRFGITLFIGLTFIGLGAWYLQHIFTSLKFTKKDYEGDDGILSDAERQSKMIVLASALLSTAIFASVLFNIFFKW